jgi:hypothetical protein
MRLVQQSVSRFEREKSNLRFEINEMVNLRSLIIPFTLCMLEAHLTDKF